MGQRTDAYIVYGIDIGDDNPFWNQNEPEEALKDAVADLGLAVLEHCSNSFPSWIIYEPASLCEARRGNPVSLDGLIKSNNNMHTADNVFARAVKKCNWLSGKPAWLLCSYWEQ